MQVIDRTKMVQIKNRVARGESVSDVAIAFNITEERVKGYLPKEVVKPRPVVVKKKKKASSSDLL